MQLKILSSLIIAVVGTSGAASRAYIPKKNVAVNKALSVRGGAGPLPAEATAKAAIAILGVQGLYEFLAPEMNVEAYDILAVMRSLLSLLVKMERVIWPQQSVRMRSSVTICHL
jgi:hypothetical protein